jgi:hypothetical protein
MAEDQTQSRKEIFDRILKGNPGRQAVANAIQKALVVFTETATQEIKKLVEANTQGPDVKAEMRKLQKTVIEMTSRAIKEGLRPPQEYEANKPKRGTTS